MTTLAELESLPASHGRFLIERMLAEKAHKQPRCYGISSDAMALYAVGLRDKPQFDEFPHDQGDLDACELTYKMAPGSLQLGDRMTPLLEEYRAFVAAYQGGVS
jgi:hypothetical protein